MFYRGSCKTDEVKYKGFVYRVSTCQVDPHTKEMKSCTSNKIRHHLNFVLITLQNVLSKTSTTWNSKFYCVRTSADTPLPCAENNWLGNLTSALSQSGLGWECPLVLWEPSEQDHLYRRFFLALFKKVLQGLRFRNLFRHHQFLGESGEGVTPIAFTVHLKNSSPFLDPLIKWSLSDFPGLQNHTSFQLSSCALHSSSPPSSAVLCSSLSSLSVSLLLG